MSCHKIEIKIVHVNGDLNPWKFNNLEYDKILCHIAQSVEVTCITWEDT